MSGVLQNLLKSPFARFAFSGGFAAMVNIASRMVLSNWMNYSHAIVIAYFIGMTTAYALMKLFVFEVSGRSVAKEYIRFVLVNAVALVQVWLVSMALVEYFFRHINFTFYPEAFAHVIGVLSPIATSYVLHKSFTFSSAKK